MSVKLLTKHYLKFLSLKGGCTDSSVCTLVKMPHCLKSHVTAQLYFCEYGSYANVASFHGSMYWLTQCYIVIQTCLQEVRLYIRAFQGYFLNFVYISSVLFRFHVAKYRCVLPENHRNAFKRQNQI